MQNPVTSIRRSPLGTVPGAWASGFGLLAALVSLGLVSGCAKKQEAAPPAAASESSTTATVASTGGHWTQETALPVFDPARFSKPAQITNEWYPMKPGTRWTYEGSAIDEEGIKIPLKMQLNVTSLTKVIGGIECVVCYDLDWKEGELVEAENAFYAQDDDGNVWLMGEYPEEYDDGNGVVTANPAWIHGLAGAKAGILVPGKPALGTPSFSQGFAQAVDFTDRGKVDSLGVRTCVPADCYDDVLVVAEGSAGEIDIQQTKYYARGVGNVRVGSRGAKDVEKQQHELTKVETVDAKELARLREASLKLDKAARTRNKMYAQSTPLKAPGAAAR